MINLEELKISFRNPNLFDTALTHRSWLNENPESRSSNETLEFLGDAVLELVVSAHLFNKFPGKDEGYLTALRANLVNTQSLSLAAKKMNLGEEIFLSKGEEEGGGRDNRSLLANTFEAVVGAIYIDRGLSSAQEFINQNLLSSLEDKLREPLKDAKSRLQEYAQSKKLSPPKYTVLSQTGPAHSKSFTIQVSIGGKPLAKGKGASKAQAQQEAAKKALSVGQKLPL